MQAELHRIDHLEGERTERALDEEDERERHEQPLRDPAAVHGARRDGEDDHGEEVHEPAGRVADHAPLAAAGHEVGDHAVQDEDRREDEREQADEPRG